ncbi:MAG: glycosyltransferase [Ignavibacteriales bacterium]|nr:glycosyltransferase [Ignavibacteriales bacterium]
MKIQILSTAYPLRGGIAHFVGLLYNELKKNHDVKVLTFKRQYPAIFFPGKTQLEGGDSGEKIPTEIIVDSVNPFNWIKVGKKEFNDAPDILIFKYWMPFFAPCFGMITKHAKKNNKTKVVVICDNVIPHENKLFDKTLTKYFFNRVDFFVVLSASVEKDLLSLYPKAKYKLLPHPIYSNFGNAIEKSVAKLYLKINDEKVILFFGFIRDYKGLDTLLLAMIELKDKNIKLLVAGEFYTDKEKYLNIIKEHRLDKNIILKTDFIPTNEVKYYFSCCDVVILPYKSATQSGIVQIAVNFKKPVIATNVGGLAEVIVNEESGYIVEKENPKALAQAIDRFYAEKKEIPFVNNISKIADKYSWKNFTDGIIELVTI